MITFRMPGIPVMESFLLVTLTFLLCLARSMASTTEAATGYNTTTPKPSWDISLHYKGSSTSSITVEWRYPAIYQDHIMEHKVKSRKKDSDSILHSPELAANESTYEVQNLLTNSHYQICVYTKFKEGFELEGNSEACEELKTLAVMRFSSIIAIIVALGYILLMILIGFICWHCAKRRQRKAQEDSGEEHDELLEKQNNPGNLLAPPPEGRPRSSIEEQLPYIPYITPPLEEIEREKRAAAANNV